MKRSPMPPEAGAGARSGAEAGIREAQLHAAGGESGISARTACRRRASACKRETPSFVTFAPTEQQARLAAAEQAPASARLQD